MSKHASSTSKAGASDGLLRQWVAQWRFAAIELPKQKARELGALTDKQALTDTKTLLEIETDGWTPPERQESSGFVEQQRFFARLSAK